MTFRAKKSAPGSEPVRPEIWHTIRGRLLLVTVVVSALLLIFALMVRVHVQRTSQRHIDHIQLRSSASHLLTSLALGTRELENRIQRYVIHPCDDHRDALVRGLEMEKERLEAMRGAELVSPTTYLAAVLDEMEVEIAALDGAIHRLFQIRSEVESWFPAMKIMRSEMFPAKNDFDTALSAVLDEAVPSAALSPPLQEVLLRLRHNFGRLVSEFRLHVADRSGIFSNRPASGPTNQTENIAIYHAAILHDLQRLEELASRGGEPSFELLTTIEQLRAAYPRWWNHYMEVKTILDSDQWRRDLLLLERQIDPLLTSIQQRLSVLQLALDNTSGRDITTLSTLSRQLSDLSVIFVVAVVALLLLALAAFHRTLLKPMTRITQALLAEAKGAPPEPIPDSGGAEIRDLAEAFQQMREQVHIRQSRLDYMAHHDSLTGLPNRILFRDRLVHGIMMAERSRQIVGLIFLDLDRFKQINDTLGHDIGDQLLQELGRRLEHYCRGGDTVARLGGDEFAIVVEALTSREQVRTIAEKLQGCLEKEVEVEGHLLNVTASLGVAIYPTDQQTPDDLIKAADTAMYSAKNAGGNRIEFYSREMTARVVEHMEMEKLLRRAVREGELTIHYQPIIDLQSRRIVAVESLLRWHHPDREDISPARFVPVLEEGRLIGTVTQWMLQVISGQFRDFRRQGFLLDHITLNLSGRLLQERGVIDDLMGELRSGRFDPHTLIIEITEDTLTRHFDEASEILSRLKELGVRIALDDFGTGQSSLNHLRKFPIDILKVDREFVRDIPDDRYDSELVAAMIAMAEKLGIEVVAEGVETEEQLAFLERHHCRYAQGYLFGCPQSEEELARSMSEESTFRCATMH
ncbi:MAG TPA: EAL domain-containing protein [Thiotrichales bacterium]|nr:EAL domain-containing protein [Thiotrichales bacterium]